MKYEAVIFPSAESDLTEIQDYLELELKISSKGLLKDFLDSIILLESNPLIFPIVKDPILAEKGFRFVRVKNYLVFYVVVDSTIQIRRFIYGRRNYSEIL